jgi:hypothetical protein
MIDLSPMRTSPEVEVSRPAMMRRSVVLPQPDGPSSETNSPSLIVSETSFSAWKAPKLLRMRSMTRDLLQRLESAETLADAVNDNIGHVDGPVIWRKYPRSRTGNA